MRDVLNGIIFSAILILVICAVKNDANLRAYNRHVCAVYGYYEDCKTPLPEELRLK